MHLHILQARHQEALQQAAARQQQTLAEMEARRVAADAKHVAALQEQEAATRERTPPLPYNASTFVPTHALADCLVAVSLPGILPMGLCTVEHRTHCSR